MHSKFLKLAMFRYYGTQNWTLNIRFKAINVRFEAINARFKAKNLHYKAKNAHFKTKKAHFNFYVRSEIVIVIEILITYSSQNDLIMK
jgi:hypothetical protein